MSPSTTTASFSVDIFPTMNSLDPEERSRLLRSSRKIGNVLGTTPFVLEMQSSLNPSPKKTRREGGFFHSPSSSISSINTSEPDYVVIKSNTHSAPYQHQSLAPLSDSPTPKPRSETKLGGKRRKGANSALPPVALVFDIPGSQTRSGSAATTKGSSQPLLLRIRPVLAGNATDSYIKSSSNRMIRVPSKTLSPVASTFNMNVTSPASPTSPTTPTPASVLSEREKRRKMAKLTRTLGENIPPELVFRPSPRRTSLSISRPRTEYTSSFSKPTQYVSPPSLSVAESPMPPARTSSLEQPAKAPKRRHRPRSLTLGSSSAIAQANIALTRGTASKDVPPTTNSRRGEVGNNKSNDQPFISSIPTHVQPVQAGHRHSESTEFGRRKEREWSGEWNLKDMDDVARRLRGLKGR